MKTLLVLFLLLIPEVAFTHSLVFVHLGKELPPYIWDAIDQARLFNENTPIFLIANRPALAKIEPQSLDKQLILIAAESLATTTAHQQFKKISRHDQRYRQGFWRYTTERFFYIHELMLQENLHNVFHLESDTMLYVSLSELLPIFCENYPGIGAIFDHPHRCIPSFIYFSTPTALQPLAAHLADNAKKGICDLYTLGSFKTEYGSPYVDPLPIIPPEYLSENPLIYSNQIETFHSIFDGAALGQYLGGIDPRNGHSEPGFINEACIFNPSHLQFSWETDSEGRRIPFMTHREKRWRINNLHIHSKNLKPFSSK